MAVRLLHVPTIVSLRQLEDSGSPPALPRDKRPSAEWCAATKVVAKPDLDLDTLPLADAVGAGLPLYQYPAGGSMLKPPRMSLGSCASDEVPDFFMPGTDSWDISNDQHLPGLGPMIQAGNLDGKGATTPTCDESIMRDERNKTDPAMVVPVCPAIAIPTAAGKTTDVPAWPMLSLPQPFLHLSLPSDDLTSQTLSDNDMLSGSSEPCSPGSSPMEMSPRPSFTGLAKRAARSTLDTLITALWEDCDARGLFRYDVAACSNRVLPGVWGWVAQLNEGRSSKKRPTELKVDAVLQPFDAGKFNFGRAFLREVLLEFEPLPSAGGEERGWAVSKAGAQVIESHAMPADPTLVMINVSPIDYGHVLLVPHVLDQRPQQLEPQGLTAALAFTRELANPTFRLGYNSLGAFATINHLHFQGYYLENRLPCEKAATQPIRDFHHDTLIVSELVDYPVLGWVVEVRPGQDPVACEGDMAAMLMQICAQLQNLDQPFNVLLVDQGKRAFIWPQCYAERQAAGLVPEELLETGVNPAVFEVAGHLVLKRSEDFHGATDEWARRLLAGVSLPAKRFEQLTRLCLQLDNSN